MSDQHQINNNEQQTQDMDIDNIDDDEDLDAFLVLLESRLRADFTSPDLSRIISSQGTSSSSANRGGGTASLSTLPSGNLSSPTKFIRLIYKVFTKAGKPIKLRIILSVLGLDDDDTIERDAKNSSNTNGMSSFATSSNFNKDDSDELQDRKTDEVVYKLLTKAEEDDEKWVRVIAGIIKRIMFSKPSTTSQNNSSEILPKEMSNEKKESESDKQLQKIVTNILSSINKTSTQAEQRYNEAKLKLYKQIDEESTDEIEVQQKQSAASNTLSTYLIGSDLYPTYVPLRYTLLSPTTINSIIPNVNTNVHFTSNMNANVLKIDAEVDAKRAEEEGKEMLSVQQKQQVGVVTATNGSSAGDRGTGGRATNQPSSGGAVLAGRMRGRFSNTAGRGSTTTSGSSLFRPSTTGKGSAAGRMGTVGGRAGRISGRGGGRLGVGRTGGRVGSLARLTGGRGTTTVRGSISAPLQRRVPGAARAILNSSSGRGRGGTISGKASSGGGGEKTKMKMIDASEVEGLTRQANEKEKTSNMTSVQARKLERKRKLMETAKASGLRGREKKIAKTEAVEAATAGNDQATKSSTSGSGTDASQNKSTNVTGASASQQVQQQQQPPSAAYVSLLEKSNKLTPEDRQTILLFFQNRNPVQPGLRPPSLSLPPGADEATGVFKVKINEEKTFDESTNENVKETLYLELNYKTLGFKKTRKIKRK